MNIKQQREAALKAAREIAERAKSEKRGLTDDEQGEVNGFLSEADALGAQIKSAAESDALMQRLSGYAAPAEDEGRGEAEGGAKSLGEHFVKSVGPEGLNRVKTLTGVTVAAQPFTGAKALGDPQDTTGEVYRPILTEYDRTIVREYRRPSIVDLMGSGTLSGNAVTYLVEGAVDGDFATVAEGGAKPPITFGDPTTRTDALKKIAGVLRWTDEMAEDLPFIISEINNRGLYMLSMAEERQLLNGNGTGSNVLGLLNRSGIQTEAAGGAGDKADALFRASTKVQTATGLTADGVVINPLDYQELRLSRDGNDQYYGGGFFTGAYGNGGMLQQPPIWGMRTIVSAAVPAGTAVVAAFAAATTVYRKGGIRVESTNSHEDDFTNNLITTRIEERVALAVRVPAAVVSVDLTGA